ncbi:MAG TPA: peptide ABC transporter substrate-binding protein [Negativicutes bacterium]
MRRGFVLQYRDTLICTLLIAALLLGGCSSSPKNDLQIPAKRDIQSGGQLVYGSLQEPNILNPLLSDLLATAEVGRLLFSGLVLTNDKGEWLPDLALEVPTVQNGGLSQDGLTVTYRLRKDVKWHDGLAVTADDVRFTWQLIMNHKVNVITRDGYDKIAAIDTPDPYTVVVRFKEYYAPFLTLFPTILPKHALESESDINKSPFNRAPIGSGPFKFKEWRIAEAIVLQANPSYFRGKPTLDSIVYKIIPDTNILLTQLRSGEVDIVSNIAYAQLDQVKGIAGIRSIITPNMIWEHLDFNLDNALFQDKRVRQAIALGIDRQAMIDTVLKSIASPAVGDQSPLSWAYNTGLQPAGRDIAVARELLVQAGWQQGTNGIFSKDGRQLTFSLAVPSGNKMRELIAQNIVQQLKEVGIGVEIRLLEGPVFFGDVLKNRRFETALYAWVAGLDPDDMSFWNSKKIPSRNNGYDGQNYPGWRNPEVDTLTEQGIRTVDIETRKQIYFRVQELLVQEYPVIPLYFRANLDAVKNTVANYQPNATSTGNMWNAWQWGLMTK